MKINLLVAVLINCSSLDIVKLSQNIATDSFYFTGELL